MPTQTVSPKKTPSPKKAADKKRVLALRKQGLTIKQITQKTGLSKTVVATMVPRTTRRADAIDRDSLLHWLEPMTVKDPQRGYCFNGKPLSSVDDTGKWHRSFYRLREEGVCWSYITLDEFCCKVLGCHFNDFFDWCREYDHRAWANGQPPSWWDEDPDWKEINRSWADPDAPIKRRRKRQKKSTSSRSREPVAA